MKKQNVVSGPKSGEEDKNKNEKKQKDKASQLS